MPPKNMQAIKELFYDFLSLLFPLTCYNCNEALVQHEEILCTSCRHTLPETNYHFDLTNELYQKFAYESKVLFASSFLFYNREGISQRLIHQMKYRNTPEIGHFLGRLYGFKLAEIGVFADAIVPVPIHATKMRLRGFNQSAIFAEGLSESLKIPVNYNSVIRKVKTKSQTKKSKVQRWENVQDVYRITDRTFFEDKKIIIVDDVITTGATLGILIDELVKARVGSIAIISMAVGQ